jgi:hypothetical protein
MTPGARSTRFAALIAAAAALTLALGPVSASGASIGGFGVRPAQFNPSNLATRAYFIIDATGGSIRREAVVVSNDNSLPLVLDVDPVDGLTGVTSGVVYGNRGVALGGAGAWVTPELKQVTVAPHRSIDVGFAVRIPPHAAAGDHLAGISFEAIHPKQSGGNFAVTVVVRTVVGIEIQVAGHATRHLRLSSLALAPLPGTTVPSAVVTLEDDGHKLCHPELAVAITGKAGTTTVSQKLGTILPGDTIAYPFRWPGALAQGSYGVSATGTGCGPRAAIHTIATYSLTTPATAASGSSKTVAPSAPLATTTSDSWSWWAYVLVALGGMLAGGVLVRFASRRRGA